MSLSSVGSILNNHARETVKWRQDDEMLYVVLDVSKVIPVKGRFSIEVLVSATWGPYDFRFYFLYNI